MAGTPPIAQQVAGAVLTGGQSRRMGRDKATIEVDGVPMAQRTAAVLHAVGCEPVVAIGGDAEALRALDLETVPDRWPGEGPLAAIVTALAHISRPTLVVACDLPRLDPDTLRTLLAAANRGGEPPCDAVIAATDRLEPLCALWMPSSLPALEAALGCGERAVHRAIGTLRVVTVAVLPDALVNVNTPADLGHTQR